MNVCNLFKPLENPTGNFLMFSQYAEDLTRELSDGSSYNVVPSKFICINYDYAAFNKTGKLNIDFPTKLQQYYENALAYNRDNNSNWKSSMALELLWKMMNITNDSIQYIGEINFQSYDEHKNIGYSEIFCWIPDSAKKTNYPTLSVAEGSKLSSEYGLNHVLGYTENIDGVCDVVNDELVGCKYIEPSIENNKITGYVNIDEAIAAAKPMEDKYFEFNTIIVLYDICSKSTDAEGHIVTEKIEKNVPLGIYLTGLINADGTVTNHVTKYSGSEDIYGAGTSYGLRICSRFSINPNMAIKFKDTDTTIENCNYSAFAQTLGELGDNLAMMRQIAYNSYQNNENLKKLIASINNSVNVPYIKEINGKQYWFINGRNTGITAEGGSVEEIVVLE